MLQILISSQDFFLFWPFRELIEHFLIYLWCFPSFFSFIICNLQFVLKKMLFLISWVSFFWKFYCLNIFEAYSLIFMLLFHLFWFIINDLAFSLSSLNYDSLRSPCNNFQENFYNDFHCYLNFDYHFTLDLQWYEIFWP